jgi:hypothetical protein
VTFKDLQKLIHNQQSEFNSEQTTLFQALKNKPFWIWDVEEHKQQDVKTKWCLLLSS